MPADRQKLRSGAGVALAAVAVFLPILVLFGLLWRDAVNLPQLDDYDAVLGFLNHYQGLSTSSSRLLYFVTSQHVQYKLLLLHAAVLADWRLTGHVNFLFLGQLGNLFLLLIVFACWLCFRPRVHCLRDRLLLFVPAVLLLTMPCEQELLDWATASLQHLPAIAFSLLGLRLLFLPSRAAFAGACASLALAIAASGNGFLLAPFGLWILFRERRFQRVAIWCTLAVLLAALYAYHYQRTFVQAADVKHPVLVDVLFPFVFLGAAALRMIPALVLSIPMVAGFLLLARRGWAKADPVTFSAAVFCVLSALGVDLTRHGLGLHAAVASRYAIFSQLLLALLYLAAVNLGLLRVPRLLRSASWFAVSVFFLCGLWTGITLEQNRVLASRTRLLSEHYEQWTEHPGTASLVPDEEPGMHSPEMLQFRQRAAAALAQARQLGTFEPVRP